ncbi:MAG: polyprenyl synthetase family protein [Bacteroidales bacterium]|nr:polyprenyl synthetase family protein [Bacteroidales bacterium]
MAYDFNKHFATLFDGETPKELYVPITYALSTGGKRLRPQLVLTACNMFGGTIDNAWPVISAIEVFHNFTLLHDDIMDNADVRRGRPTVHKQFDESTAILSGDAMMIEAYRCLEAMPHETWPQVFPLFSQTAIEICRGQQYDKNFEMVSSVSLAEYLEMIRLKTAVLMACALKLGAIAANAPEKDANLLYEVGINIGVAFQLQDDYLDLYGDPKTFGKAIGGDVACGKKTFLYILVQDVEDIRVKEHLNRYYASKDILLSDRLNLIRELYNKNLIPQRYESYLNSYLDKAGKALDEIAVSEEMKKPLRELIERIAIRKK